MLRQHPKKKLPASLLWTALALVFVVAMITHPKDVFQGATMGLKTWWDYVFPSLLPFFISAEILMRLGFVKFLGVLLEPIMRPLFNVPGSGAFVMVVGYTSGFPIGGMVTAQLRQQGLCTRVEGERLMSFTNNSSPLFMLTAVSVGMFGKPELGLVIAGSHYLANLLLGLALRFYGRSDRTQPLMAGGSWSVRSAFSALLQHQRTEQQPLGKLLGESVASSVTKLINIGGFIILFAVIIRLLNEAGVIAQIAAAIGLVLVPLGFAPDILTALASGFFEMTIGNKLASEAAATELQQLMAVGMILGWSGLSIHAQVASMIAQTDLRMGIFVATRITHAMLAACLTWLFYQPISAVNLSAVPVVSPVVTWSHFHTWVFSLQLWLAMTLMLVFLTLIGVFYQAIASFIQRDHRIKF